MTLVVKGFLDEPADDVSGSDSAGLILAPAAILGLAGVAIRYAL